MNVSQPSRQQGIQGNIHQSVSVCYTFQGTKSADYQRSNNVAANVFVLRTSECGAPKSSSQGGTADTHSQISTSQHVSMDSHRSSQLEIDLNQMARDLEQEDGFFS